MYDTAKYYDEKIPIEQILYGEFIKYDSMLKLVGREFAGSDATEINVFIDLYQFFLPIFTHLRVENYYSMTACALNYCAHIRDYFRTRHGVKTNIVLISTLNMSANNTKYYPKYNYKYRQRIEYNEKIMGVYKENMSVLKLLTAWIPKTYYKEGTVEAGVMIRHAILNEFNNGLPNVIISQSDYMYQLPSYLPQTVVFRKKSSIVDRSRLDESFSYNGLTAGMYYIKDNKGSVKGDITLPSNAMSVFMTLNGIPRYGINSLYNISTVLKIVNTMDVNDITYGDIDRMYEHIANCIPTKRLALDRDGFANRFMAIDARFQEKLYAMSPEANDKTYLTDTCNIQGVKEINDKYFIKTPIDLQRLIQ